MTETATIGGGCYWCLDAIYRRVRGVTKVRSGYSGGHVNNPTLDQVYAGGTGHAEVIQITFKPASISFQQILEIFFVMHNPTTLNRQDYDQGEIYRSVIFYHSDEQKRIAEGMVHGFATELWDDPIVTEVKPYDTFWPADEYMQEYYEKHPTQGYCQMIIDPKIQKLRQKFATMLKPETIQ